MITYSNIKRFDNLQFEEYLKLEGYSHSFLKRERNGITQELTMTDNIIMGKLVDGILTDPGAVDMSNVLYPSAKIIAFDIKQTFGDLIKFFVPQISFTADVEYKGFLMPTTGRLDWLLPGHAVIDLKCTKAKANQLPGLIDFMGYKNQVWHYCKMAKMDKAYLMFHSIPDKKTLIIFIDCSLGYNEFWAEKTMMFGKIAA